MTTLIVLASIIGLLVMLALWLQKRLPSGSALPRKVLHLGAISTCAFAVFLVSDVNMLRWAATGALPVVGWMVMSGWFSDVKQGRKSWGMVYFVLVYGALLWVFGESHPHLVFYPMLLLAIADGMATMAGERAAGGHFRMGGDQRSFLGSAVFFFSVLAVLWIPASLAPELLGWKTMSWPWMVFLACFLTLTEAISARGRDNLWIPLLAAYWLLVLDEVPYEAFRFLLLLALVPVLAYFAFRKKWLDQGGAATASLMGWVLLISPEPRFLLPAGLFFILGTALSVLPKKSAVASEKPSRSKPQVLANGGVATALLMVHLAWGCQPALIGFFVGFAAALSDTASSEIGTRVAGRSYAIFGFQQLPAGSSGGISWAGTLAGIIFAVPIPLLAWWWGLVTKTDAAWMMLIALIANLLDSALGQVLQAKTIRADGSWEDGHKQIKGNITAGWRWMNNDWVNAISTGLAALAAMAFWAI